MSFKPSKYQEKIFDHIRNSSSNAVVEAVAGSGKTTTLIESMKISNIKESIFVAFNKHIADEMKEKVPNGVKVSTMHSFGLEQIKRVYKNVKIEPHKTKKILKDNIKILGIDDVFKNRNEYVDDLLALGDLFRLNVCYDLEDCQKIASKHQIIANDHLIFNSLKFVGLLNKNRDIIDYIDMIYIPAVEDIIIKQYDLVLVDECQDLPASQISLLRKMVTSNGRIIAVGDRNQAIYGFGGADSESFQKLCNMPNTELLPLSISYRCSKSVVEHAQKIVPSIEHSETAIEGYVEYGGNPNDIKKGDFVLCRTNAPLISLAFSFLRKGEKAMVKGVDIGARIMKTLKDTKKQNIKDAIKTLKDRLEHMIEGNTIDSKLNTLYTEDIVNSAEILSIGCTTLEEVKTRIDSIFKDNKDDGIILSTVHKSKGLEANRVHIIKHDLLPLKFVTKDWEKQQEQNLHYVAITRAKEGLIYHEDV